MIDVLFFQEKYKITDSRPYAYVFPKTYLI